MTRGKIIYLDSDQKAYSTIEFNGDMYPEGHGDEIIERFEENYFTSFTVYWTVKSSHRQLHLKN